MATNWQFIAFEAEEVILDVHSRSSSYGTLFRIDSDVGSDPHYLAIVYPSTREKDFVKFLKDHRNSQVSVRVLFHTGQLGLVRRGIRTVLKAILPKSLEQNISPVLQEVWKGSIAEYAEPSLSSNQIGDFELFDPVKLPEIRNMPTLQECETFIHDVFAEISQTHPSQMNPVVLLDRDIPLYSWLLQKQHGFVPYEDLLRLVGNSQKRRVDDLLGAYIYRELFAKVPGEGFVVTENMMQAIETIYNESGGYRILQPVPYFPPDCTGARLVEYFTQLASPAIPLPSMMLSALDDALHKVEIEMLDQETQIFLVSGPEWQIMVYTRVNNGAISKTDLNQLIIDLITARQRNPWPGLLFAPNSENIEVFKRSTDFPGIHHVWSITAVRFWHRLKGKIEQHGSELVTRAFDAVIPPDGESFSSATAMNRLENKIRLIKKQRKTPG